MSGLITNLGINWMTLLAQLINFAILLFVLQKFLYKPILSMLDKRRADIEKSKRDSEEIEAKIKSIDNMKEEILSDARRESESIIKKSELSAAELEKKILAQAREEAKKITAEESKKLTIEHDRLVSDVKKEIGGLIGLAVEKTLGDALDEKAKKNLAEKTVVEAHNIRKS